MENIQLKLLDLSLTIVEHQKTENLGLGIIIKFALRELHKIKDRTTTTPLHVVLY